jgi:toxin CptA
VVSALCVLAALAAASLMASELPRPVAWLSAAAVFAAGLWRARRESRQRPCSIVIAADDRTTVDGLPVESLDVQWRGSLAFLCWRDAVGRRQRRGFWPDTLPAGKRRELRLAAPPRPGAPGPSGMAH